MSASETPMMQQFRKIKEQYPDALLLFRCGDFYETYSDDAVRAAKILNITLTKRNNGGKGEDIAMAGFPYHALDTYLPKLVRAGMRVAICDQLEDPKLAKKLVKRGVTELVTPGVSYSDTTIENRENNFVACIYMPKKGTKGQLIFGLSFLDISTGEFLVAQGSREYADKLLSNFAPKEVLYERGRRQEFENWFGNKYFTFELEDWMLTLQAAQERLNKQFETSNLKGFGVEQMTYAIVAAGGILHYLDMTQHLQTSHIRRLNRIEEDNYVWLDRFTIRNLEIFSSLNAEATTLLTVLDRTKSHMGGRMLRRWIGFPLKDKDKIRRRQEVVEQFFRDTELRDHLIAQISTMGDMERLVGKVSTGRINPRDMLQLARSLAATEEIKKALANAEYEPLSSIAEKIDPCTQMRKLIEHTIAANPPMLTSKPDYIRSGVNKELDELRDIQHGGKDKLLDIQRQEAKATGIQSLKIGFNNVFGYYLEVRNTFKELVPKEWIRKQTLAQAERYITPELKQYEEKIIGAEEKIAILEMRIFQDLILQLTDFVGIMQADSQIVAQIDCLLSFAVAAEENKYVCPEVNDSLVIDIKNGRHPVIEKQMAIGEKYVANDIMLDNNSQQIIILTGPNMAGKSALLRQTALIVLMAQCGSFVPADSASIGIVDKIFTRVGASDNISAGESTFMVEMNEAAAILNNLSERSLVLFDELGRGTSTYDGISIAWAIVEYIHENRYHAKTLFATHYHELNEMEKTFRRIRNYNVSVKEIDHKVIFLRKLVRGGSEHSFGIHVAKLAGMPQTIINRAQVILKELEHTNKNDTGKQIKGNIKEQKSGMQLSFFQLDDPVLESVRDEIKNLDIDNLTPIEALMKLHEIKKIVGN